MRALFATSDFAAQRQYSDLVAGRGLQESDEAKISVRVQISAFFPTTTGECGERTVETPTSTMLTPILLSSWYADFWESVVAFDRHASMVVFA
jgi:hypothetical protein